MEDDTELYWISTNQTAIIVRCKNDIIIGISTMFIQFVGIKLVGFINWLETQGSLIIHKIENITELEKC